MNARDHSSLDLTPCHPAFFSCPLPCRTHSMTGQPVQAVNGRTFSRASSHADSAHLSHRVMSGTKKHKRRTFVLEPLEERVQLSTMSPASVSLGAGSLLASTKTQTVPLSITLPPEQVDIAFLLDDTGSFDKQFGQTLDSLFAGMASSLQANFPNVSFGFGVAQFEDYGGPGRYSLRISRRPARICSINRLSRPPRPPLTARVSIRSWRRPLARSGREMAATRPSRISRHSIRSPPERGLMAMVTAQT